MFLDRQRIRALTDTPWAPFEVAHWRWRRELADRISRRSLEAHAVPAFEVFDDGQFVARHQRTLKNVIRVLGYWGVPARHIHRTVQVPNGWDQEKIEALRKKLLQQGRKGITTDNIAIKTKNCRTPVYNVNINDPRSPVSGLLTGCVWLRLSLERNKNQSESPVSVAVFQDIAGQVYSPHYSTVTDLARFRGLSTSVPFSKAT